MDNFTNLQPEVVEKKANQYINPYQTKHVSMFDPIVVKEVLRKKKTLSALFLFTALCVVFIILAYTEHMNMIAGSVSAVVSGLVAFFIFWTNLRPTIIDTIAVSRYM